MLIINQFRNNSFETEDGSKANQEGEMEKIDDEHSFEKVKGGFSYTDDDGQNFSITYTADENGYRPVRQLIFLYHFSPLIS